MHIVFRHGARADIADNEGQCVVARAAGLRDSRYLSALCQEGVQAGSMDAPGDEGASPLMLACQAQQMDNVKSLLKKKVKHFLIYSVHVHVHLW